MRKAKVSQLGNCVHTETLLVLQTLGSNDCFCLLCFLLATLKHILFLLYETLWRKSGPMHSVVLDVLTAVVSAVR